MRTILLALVAGAVACSKSEPPAPTAVPVVDAEPAAVATASPSAPHPIATHALPPMAHHHDAAAPSPSAGASASPSKDAGPAKPAAASACPKGQIMAAGECVVPCDQDKPKCPAGKTCGFAQFRNESGEMQGDFICQ